MLIVIKLIKHWCTLQTLGMIEKRALYFKQIASDDTLYFYIKRKGKNDDDLVKHLISIMYPYRLI